MRSITYLDWVMISCVSCKSMTLKQLGEKSKIPPHLCSRHADKLESIGWIKTEKVGRERLIDITPYGKYFKNFSKQMIHLLKGGKNKL